MMEKHSSEIKATHEEKTAVLLSESLNGNSRQSKDIPTGPCYARVNLLKCTVQEAVDKLCEDGWNYVGRLHVYRFKKDVSSLVERQFGLDPLLEDVMVFPFNTDLQQNRLVVDRILVLQERASCVPARVLNPSPGSVVLDCCAAPGNKTSHLASLMSNQGRIIAMDRNPKGLNRINSLLKKTGATCVDTIAQNFLTLSVDSSEVSDITMILLDPPCIDKGIPLTTDEHGIPSKDQFIFRRHQTEMLRHALQFPNVQRVVYSTSSSNVEEGEEIVQEVMFDFGHEFHFRPVFPEWPFSRGSEWFLNHKSFLRVSPEEHLTSGTFVACFERIKKHVTSDYEDVVNWHPENGIEFVDENIIELYREAAKILQIDSEGGNASRLVHSSDYKNLRQLFALVREIIKYKSILKDILKRSKLPLMRSKLINNDIELAVVLLYEELIGDRFKLPSEVRKVMRKHKAKIEAALDAFLKENNAASLEDVVNGKSEAGKGCPALPCYVRVNLIKCSVQNAVNRLCESGWEHVGKLHIHRFKEHVMSLSERQFGLDPLLEDVFVFPFFKDIQMDQLVVDGILVLQERASCVPAHVLSPPPGSVILDCFPNPGNRTSHLASLMENQGRVIAVETDAVRASALNSALQKTGTTCVEIITQNFLSLSHTSEELADVTMILVDPSCSSTGVSSSRMGQVSCKESSSTLNSLYVSLLKHALRFPNVQRVVYSTCSPNKEENEQVVEEVMCKVKQFFHFLPVLPNWPNSRGSKWFLNHKSFLRVEPDKHLTDGYFVACFERIRKCNFLKTERKRLGEESEFTDGEMKMKEEDTKNIHLSKHSKDSHEVTDHTGSIKQSCVRKKRKTS